MKAVIWTDVFQTVVMLTGLLSLIIKGLIEVGGFGEVWSSAKDTDRIEFFDFDLDPTTRHTFWTLVVGSFFGWMMPYTVDQQMVQRFASTKNITHARRSLLYNLPGMFTLITLCCWLGLIMFAYYQSCDPGLAGRIDDANQMVPLMVLDVLGFAPGLPGLFTASLFSGALSSVSSILNALSAVTWEDFFKMFVSFDVTEEKATIITKLLVICYGLIGIAVAFIVGNLGGTVLQMSLTFNGAAGAPLVGMFLLGAFFPWVKAIGAAVGGVCGFAFPMWVSVGAYVNKPPVTEDRPLYTDGCPGVTHNPMGVWENHTMGVWESLATAPMEPEITGINRLYSLSYLWMSALGICTTVVVGLVVTLLTGAQSSDDVDPALLISYADHFWCCLPERYKLPLRCGVDYKQRTESTSQVQAEKASKADPIQDLKNKQTETAPGNDDVSKEYYAEYNERF